MSRTVAASSRRRASLVGGVLALALAGCGSSTYPVEGKVLTPDGQPVKELEGGTIVFESVDAKVSSQGSIGADGSFRLSTFKPNDGAPPGKYRALITAAPVMDLDNPPKPVIDRRFNDFKTSGWEVTVERKQNVVSLTVERARGRR